MTQAAHRAVANGDQEALGRHCGAGQHVDGGLLQVDTGQVNGGKLARDRLHIALHFGRFAQEHIHGHIDRTVVQVGCIRQHKLTLFSCHTHD